MHLTSQQTAVILAALRYFQSGRRGPEIKEIATNGGEFPALTPDEIDELCE